MVLEWDPNKIRYQPYDIFELHIRLWVLKAEKMHRYIQEENQRILSKVISHLVCYYWTESSLDIYSAVLTNEIHKEIVEICFAVSLRLLMIPIFYLRFKRWELWP